MSYFDVKREWEGVNDVLNREDVVDVRLPSHF